MTQADCVHSTPPTNTPIDTTRRHLLTIAAGGAVAAIAIITAAEAAGSPADPVFAAIDAHRQANAAHWAAIKASEGSTDWSITEKPMS